MAIDYTASIVAAANKAGVNPNLALAVAQTESSMNPSAVSSAGAVGLFQLMPSSFPGVNIGDTQTNIDTGVSYLAQLLNQYNGNTSLALAAYNAGPGNVAKYGGVPPFSETQNYIASVNSLLSDPQWLLSHKIPQVTEA
jgi:soluble lytic murein transglycosylase-like protein